MFEVLFGIGMILQIVFMISLVRLIFRSQRASAKRWLKLSGGAFMLCLVPMTALQMHRANEEAVALGFQDSADRQNAKSKGVDDAAVWSARKVELERKAAIETAAANTRKAADAKLAAWKEQNCDKDLDCIGKKKRVTANALCSMVVERLATYQAEWTDGFGERKFPYYRWGDQAGVVTYYGGAIKFQNGFGAWQDMVYECDFDIRQDQPIDARAQVGRLQ